MLKTPIIHFVVFIAIKLFENKRVSKTVFSRSAVLKMEADESSKFNY